MNASEINLELDLGLWREKLVKAIDQDSRQVAILNARIRTNRSLLNYVQASLDGYLPPDPATDKPEVKQPRKRRTKNEGRTKQEFILSAIRSLPADREFVADDVFAAVHRLFPLCGITRKHVSSLMWKLSEMPQGKGLFRQTVPWTGGNVQARYARLEEGEIRTRTRGATPSVSGPDLLADLGGVVVLSEAKSQ